MVFTRGRRRAVILYVLFLIWFGDFRGSPVLTSVWAQWIVTLSLLSALTDTILEIV